MKIHELMRTHVIKTTPEATMRDIVDLMDIYQVTMLPVVDSEDHVVGVITEPEVSAAILPGLARVTPLEVDPQVPELAVRIASVRVADVMRPGAAVLDESDDVGKAISLMATGSVSRLPVTSEGRLVGTISQIDVFQGFLEAYLAPPLAS